MTPKSDRLPTLEERTDARIEEAIAAAERGDKTEADRILRYVEGTLDDDITVTGPVRERYGLL